jgi:predicted GNAT superfamily acetyltransferase
MAPVVIREARERADFEACVALQREVWGLCDIEITSLIQLVATVHAGGLLLVALEGAGAVVGFSYAFAALRGGEPHLHSDMLAVRPDARGHGLGTRLKWAQREAALARGLRLVTWTFDPMRARNARLNLRRLGAVVREILPDFYGPTTSDLHHGLPTDRLLARWDLESARVRARARGDAPPSPDGGASVLAAEWGRGLPRPGEVQLDREAARLLVEVPADWDHVCSADQALAVAWQDAVRTAFRNCLARGYAATDLATPVEEGRPRPRYVLERVAP